MNFPEFFSQIELNKIEVVFDFSHEAPAPRLSNEAMFHLPLIAITILMIAKGRSKPAVDHIGQLVGDCFERTFVGFRGSAQHLGWSATLRVRTVQALAFLEAARLAEVSRLDKKIFATDAGRSVIDHAISAGGDLAQHLFLFERSYRDIRAQKKLRLSI